MKIMKIDLKWVHIMARYGLILKLDGDLWHTIISGPLLTPKRAMESSKIRKKVKKSSRAGQGVNPSDASPQPTKAAAPCHMK